jgi:flagellar biosynthesis/type III secretory pathway M-ring protein FliF/YscJ
MDDKLKAAQDALKAGQDALPIVAKHPLETALLIVAIFAAAIIALAALFIWYQSKHLARVSNALETQVNANKVQAVTLEGMTKHVEHLPAIREWLAVIATSLNVRGPRMPLEGKGG